MDQQNDTLVSLLIQSEILKLDYKIIPEKIEWRDEVGVVKDWRHSKKFIIIINNYYRSRPNYMICTSLSFERVCTEHVHSMQDGQ